MTDLPHVDVVVTHYEDPRRLVWVLTALSEQTYPQSLLHVIVADDGSRNTPSVAPNITVVSQADEGFRAAAARNLGAAQGCAPIVLFLDGDTVPEPGYVSAMVAALDGLSDSLGALVVGRRRHADLTGLAEAGLLRTWLTDPVTRPQRCALTDPAWLLDGYARTRNLADAGPDDWRYVISAVLGMTRAAFERLGGFDATLIGYGGEDWDLAYRAWNIGCELRHAPDAIAWHDGPDAGGRAELADLKQGEQLALAARIPQPLVRGRAVHWPIPRVVVRANSGVLPPSVAYAIVESWLALGDVVIFGVDPAPLGLTDPRVHLGTPTPDIADRAEFVVDLTAPAQLQDPAGLLHAGAQQPRRGRGVEISRTRDQRRGRDVHPLPDGLVVAIPADQPLDLESWGRTWWQ